MEESLAELAPLTLAELYRSLLPGLLRYLRFHFPRVCGGSHEDAAQEAFVAALRFPERIEEARLRGGLPAVERLCRTIAWRAARARLVRGSARREVGGQALEAGEVAYWGGQEWSAELCLHLEPRLRAAAATVAPVHAASLQVALRERLTEGGSDTEVAARHGLRREYLNRARRQVEAELGGLVG